MTDKRSDDWYCPTCKAYVSGESVTYEEVHVVCGTFIGEVWQKTKASLEQRVEGLESLLGRAADYIERSNSDDLHDLVGLPPAKDTVELLRKEALAKEKA